MSEFENKRNNKQFEKKSSLHNTKLAHDGSHARRCNTIKVHFNLIFQHLTHKLKSLRASVTLPLHCKMAFFSSSGLCADALTRLAEGKSTCNLGLAFIFTGALSKKRALSTCIIR